MKAINPATGEVIQDYPGHSDQEVQDILDRAQSAFQSWRNTDFPHRATLMKKAAGVLESNKARYAKLMSLEMGKPIIQAAGEVDKCTWVCNYYADNGESMLADEPAESDGSKAYVAFQPLGVISCGDAVELPYVASLSVRRSQLDGRQCRRVETCIQRPRIGTGYRGGFSRGGFP